MIQKLQILLVLGVGLGLGACNSETGQANDQAPVQNGADLNATAAQPAVELPPGIAVSRPYRCADGSTVYVDFLSDNKTANLRIERHGSSTQLKAADEGGPFVADGYSVSANADETERSEERRLGKECGSKSRTRGAP